MTGTKVFSIWKGMLSRCNNANGRQYKDYGGRGIKVCKRWRKFENFYADMGDRPSPQHTLERINNNGNYTPSNCCWLHKSKQSKNRRNSRFLTTPWGRLTIAETARRIGASWFCIFARHRRGLRGPQLFAPPRPGGRRKMV